MQRAIAVNAKTIASMMHKNPRSLRRWLSCPHRRAQPVGLLVHACSVSAVSRACAVPTAGSTGRRLRRVATAPGPARRAPASAAARAPRMPPPAARPWCHLGDGEVDRRVPSGGRGTSQSLMGIRLNSVRFGARSIAAGRAAGQLPMLIRASVSGGNRPRPRCRWRGGEAQAPAGLICARTRRPTLPHRPVRQMALCAGD